MKDVLLVFCTCPNLQEARSLAHAVVERRLAACANLLPGLESIYHWQGKVEQATEVLLYLKTTHERFDALRAYIEAAHSYDVPEIIAVPILEGSRRYLEWIAESVETDERNSGF